MTNFNKSKPLLYSAAVKKSVLWAFVFILITSCSHKRGSTEKIEKLRKDFREATTDAQRIKIAVALDSNYQDWLNKYPDDSLAPEFAFRDAEVNSFLRKTVAALKMYEKVYTMYPKNKRAPFAMMASANVYDEVIMDKNKAKSMYLMIIEKYPNDTMAEQAKQLLKIEEIGVEKYLQQKLSADSANKVKNPQ